MGTPQKPHPVKLVTGIISSSHQAIDISEKCLTKAFGRIDYKSKDINFDFTEYYVKDMGQNLFRRFYSFKRLIDPSRLPRVKIYTNQLESRLSAMFKAVDRPVNIDPGYLTDAKLVFASTKDYCHRIYLDKKIYAEITLYYQKNTFKPHSWTYPDYKTEDYIKVFNDMRVLFMQQRR
jgi:hypothetical protein